MDPTNLTEDITATEDNESSSVTATEATNLSKYIIQ
jgi:hypothetical protein